METQICSDCVHANLHYDKEKSTETSAEKNAITLISHSPDISTTETCLKPSLTGISDYSQTECSSNNLIPLTKGVQDLRNELLEHMQQLEKNIRHEVEERLAKETLSKEDASQKKSSIEHICLRCRERDKTILVNQSTQTLTTEMIEQNWLLYKMTTQFDNLKQYLTEQFKLLYEKHKKPPAVALTSKSNSDSFQSNANITISYTVPDNAQTSSCNTNKSINTEKDAHFVIKQNKASLLYPYQQKFKWSQPQLCNAEPTILFSAAHKSHYNESIPQDRQLMISPTHKGKEFEKTAQNSREELARKLVEDMFEYEDLADSNVSGVKGKKLLDPGKINVIRETVFCRYPAGKLEQEGELWKLVCEKINAKCRGVTRTLKRKSYLDCDSLPSMDDCKGIDIKNSLSSDGYEEDYDKHKKYVDLNNNTFVSESGSIRHFNRPGLTDDTFTNIKEKVHMGFTSKKDSPVSEKHYIQRKTCEKVSDLCCIQGVVNPMEQELSNGSGARSIFQKVKNESVNEERKYDESDNSKSHFAEPDLSEDIIIVHAAEVDCESFDTTPFEDSNVDTDDSSPSPSCATFINSTNSLPVTCNLQIGSSLRLEQIKREEMTRNLIESMFTREELANSNVTGARGKSMLDPGKIKQVRHSVFRTYPVKAGEEEEWLWRTLVTKINTKCRGVKRLMKRNAQIYYDELEDQKPKNIRLSSNENIPTMACKTYSAPTGHYGKPHLLFSDAFFSFDSKLPPVRPSMIDHNGHAPVPSNTSRTVTSDPNIILEDNDLIVTSK